MHNIHIQLLDKGYRLCILFNHEKYDILLT
jgi:hypothetical protein